MTFCGAILQTALQGKADKSAVETKAEAATLFAIQEFFRSRLNELETLSSEVFFYIFYIF